MPASLDSLRRAVVSVLPWLEIACSVALAALLLWKGILPGWRVLNTDFPNYYLVARLLREGYGLDRIYDWIWLERIKDHWGLDQALVGFAGLTPFSALPVVPFSIFSAIVAKRLWMLASVLFLCLSVELLSRVTALTRRRIWLLALLAVFPLRTSFLFGQMHLLVLLLLVSAYYFHRTERQIACGVCLAIAGVLKIYPLLLGGYLLWKRQWRPVFAMLCATVFLVCVGYLWFGGHLISIYAAQILPRSLQGEVLDPYSVHAASGAALFHRLFIAEPALNPAPLLNSPSLYAVLYPLWQLVILVPLLAVCNPRENQAATDQLEWAAFVLAFLVLSPVPSSYHFVVMIFSIVLLVDVLLARREYGVAGLAIALYSLISIIEFLPASDEARRLVRPPVDRTALVGSISLLPVAGPGAAKAPESRFVAYRLSMRIGCGWVEHECIRLLSPLCLPELGDELTVCRHPRRRILRAVSGQPRAALLSRPCCRRDIVSLTRQATIYG